jgi:hypothetical protein
MRKTWMILLALSTAFTFPAAAQVADTTPPPPRPTLAELGMIIYPAQDQSAEQQALDEEACSTWAETQTGIRLTAGSPDTGAAGEAAAARATQATQGAAVGGAARGAIAGVAIGAIAGDAGKGAAIGAVASGVRGPGVHQGAADRATASSAYQK